MAELSKNIRRPGGDLVAHKSPHVRRVLLPTEADLCNALGFTEEEYWDYVEEVAAKIRERPAAYDLIPDIVCDPVSLGLVASGGGLTTFGQIAVGVALTAASAMLAPKPPSQTRGTNQRTADVGGTKKFAPQFSFNSLQELANLGDLVPLIFTNKDQNSRGGIRVNSQLIWSQLVSLGRYQQLKILALFSLGEIEQAPEFKGYAIGDLLIENYHADKIYKDNTGNIPFLPKGGIIPNDIFKVDDLKHFSGTRNPTTQATFGLSNPMPNATAYHLPYELVRTRTDVSGADYRPAGRITLKKRRKLLGAWPMGAGFIDGGNASQKLGNSDVPVGTVLTYQIVGSTDEKGTPFSGIAYQQDSGKIYSPHGVEDVNAATKTVREATDSYLSLGEQYMAGTALISCYDIREPNMWPGEPWDGTEIRDYSFKVIESGRYQAVPNKELATHLSNPRWDTSGPYFSVRPGTNDERYYYKQNYIDIFNANDRYALQKATLGTISNNRKCHITEIGIKSKVFKQIQFANVNSKPSEDELYKIYDHNSSIQLGNISKYITRYSFFKLQVRKIGENTWKWLKPNQNTSVHTGLFCVKGNTPEFQYNYIRIDQPTFDQYEYRFFPWPGAAVVKEVMAVEDRQRHEPVNAIILNSSGARTSNAIKSFECDGFGVKYAGDTFHLLNKQNLSNSEWNLGEPSKIKIQQAANQVTGLSSNQYGNYDNYSISNLPFARQVQPIFTNKLYYPGYGGYVAGSGAYHTLIARFDNYPAQGHTRWSLYINPADVTDNIQGLDGPAWGQHQERGPGDNEPIEFHYTTQDGRGGKFTPATNQTANLYGVTKTEQVTLTASPTMNNQLVNIDTKPGDPGAGLRVRLTIYSVGFGSDLKYFAQWYPVISNSVSGYENNQTVFIHRNNSNLPEDIEFQVRVSVSGDVYSDNIISELNPYDAAADFWQFEGDKSSHLDGPEHQITYCNEIVRTEIDSTTNIIPEGDPATYENLAYAGLRINSSKEWTNFSQFSAYFKKGVKVESLLGGGKRSTSLFPEIAFALLTDKTIGAGAVINPESVDKPNMTIAAKFCKANGFFWDGMISDRINLREFIYQQAMYCLLDFTIIGGKFSLYPAVPFNYDPVTGEGDFKINNDKKPTIKAMFNDGNMSELNISFLPPEDRKTHKANILYRLEQENGFAETKSLLISLHGTEYQEDQIETYDLSGHCCNLEAAKTFGCYILALRKHLDHTISFKTAGHYINGVRPGDYIRVFSTTQHVQRFNNGAILEDGSVVSKDSISGNKDFFWWNSTQSEVQLATSVNFSNPLPAIYRGSLFTIKETSESDQCYKVESISFGDDGLVELTGSYSELTSDGKLVILQKWADSSNPLFDFE